MELNANEILEVLRQKGVEYFYHANTIQTSCTFLQQGHLMARGVVDERGLTQTSQQTDALDKKYGLWYDVFLDGVDIHGRARQRNFYGPVLFVFDIELLSQDWLPSLWVTKTNPQHWTDADNSSDRYFSTVEEFRQNYRKGNFDKMFVLRHIGGVLRLKPYLREIVLDNPHKVLGNIDTYSQALGALKAAARIGGMADITVKARSCRGECSCTSQYEALPRNVINNLFAP